jgi:hypothetical protein
VARTAGFYAGGSPACSSYPLGFRTNSRYSDKYLKDGVCEFRVFTNNYDDEQLAVTPP